MIENEPVFPETNLTRTRGLTKFELLSAILVAGSACTDAGRQHFAESLFVEKGMRAARLILEKSEKMRNDAAVDEE